MTTFVNNVPFKISNSDPIAAIRSAEKIVVGQIGQTLDGYIATSTGDSKYINSNCGLGHLHALRGAVDAVIVGVGCVNADDPQLTVRLCSGDHPARIVIDPRGRVNVNSSLFSDGESEVFIITANAADHPAKDFATLIELPHDNFRFDPLDIVAALKQRGMMRILVEGGNRTLSAFMDAGAVDRLHMLVAPVIMGNGIPGLQLSPIKFLDEAMRPDVTVYPMERDILFDCDLALQGR